MDKTQRGIVLLCTLLLVARANADSGIVNKAIRKYSEQKIFCLDIGERLGFKREAVSELIEKSRGNLEISYEDLEKHI